MSSIGRRVCLFLALMSVTLMMLLVRGTSLRASGQGGGRPSPTPAQRRTPRPTPRPKLPPKVTPTTTSTPNPTPSAVRQGQSYTEKVGSVALEMVLIPAGTFTMGSPVSEIGAGKNEGPQHQVKVPSFYIGRYEVTLAQWQTVTGTNPTNITEGNFPAVNVSWDSAVEFCRQLSQMTGREYRLPTEAEWEYACRAGTTAPFAFGESLSSEQANFDGHYPYGQAPARVFWQSPIPIGHYKPNAFGLYDMHGNVSEWCQDYYHDSYKGAPADGSAWLDVGESKNRVIRGGAWDNVAAKCRSAFRDSLAPDDSNFRVGFRVVSSSRS